MATLMELLAKADEIIKEPLAVQPVVSPSVKVVVVDETPKTFEQYKEKVQKLHATVTNTVLSRTNFLDALRQDDMIKKASIPWLSTWSASLRWTLTKETELDANIMRQYNETRNELRAELIQKQITVKDLVTHLKWLEDFIEKNAAFKNYYHYEIITYLNTYKLEDNWSTVTDEEKTYIRSFVTKMDATCDDLKEPIELFLTAFDSISASI